jgi:hypothetical protein
MPDSFDYPSFAMGGKLIRIFNAFLNLYLRCPRFTTPK